MFRLKQVEDLENFLESDIRELKSEIRNHISKEVKIDFVECETCGCLLDKKKAIKGEGEIRTKEEPVYRKVGYSNHSCAYEQHLATVEYIYYPYYCKIHAPKVKK